MSKLMCEKCDNHAQNNIYFHLCVTTCTESDHYGCEVFSVNDCDV